MEQKLSPISYKLNFAKYNLVLYDILAELFIKSTEKSGIISPVSKIINSPYLSDDFIQSGFLCNITTDKSEVGSDKNIYMYEELKTAFNQWYDVFKVYKSFGLSIIDGNDSVILYYDSEIFANIREKRLMNAKRTMDLCYGGGC